MAAASVSNQEWELRVLLAGAYRIIDHMGWSELIWTHTTVRIPGPEHHFLINPYGFRFDEVQGFESGPRWTWTETSSAIRLRRLTRLGS